MVKLYTDLATFRTYKKREDEFFKVFNRLEEVAKAAVGDDVIENYKSFYAEPYQYLVDAFYELYASLYPAHLTPEAVFENATKVSKNELEQLKRNVERIKATMSKYEPTVSKKGWKSNLKESDFDKYLNPEKEQEYKALISFIKAANKLSKYGCNEQIHLMRYALNKLQMDGLSVKINHSLFI